MLTRYRRRYSPRHPFYPGEVAGYALDMDAELGLYTDSLATIPAVGDGAPVGAWRDQSPNGRLFIQATAGSRPALKTGANGINGRPVVRGDGSADHLKIASAIFNAASGSVFAVIRHVGALQNANTLISSADEALATKIWTLRTLHTTALPHMGINQRSADTADTLYGSTTILQDTAYLLAWESTGTAYSFRNGGAAQTLTATSGSDTGDWTADTADRDNTVLFALQTSGGVINLLKGDIARLLVYEPQVSAADRARILEYLARVYSVALA